MGAMENESTPKVYKIIAWEGRKGWAYCVNCGDRDELYQPLYKDAFLPGQIVKCIRCGEVIRTEPIAGFIRDNLVCCLDCVDRGGVLGPLTQEDFSPGEKVVCHYCGKMIL